MSEHKGWIGVDLDATLAVYDGWKGIEHIGAPITAMVERVQGWLAEGKDVRIFTARVCVEPSKRSVNEAALAEMAIRNWCLEHIGQKLTVTNVKDFDMVELWDDRAVQVEKNTGAPVAYQTPPCPACGDGALGTVSKDGVALGIGCYVCGAFFVQAEAVLKVGAPE